MQTLRLGGQSGIIRLVCGVVFIEAVATANDGELVGIGVHTAELKLYTYRRNLDHDYPCELFHPARFHILLLHSPEDRSDLRLLRRGACGDRLVA